MLVEELDRLAESVSLYREDAACPVCGEDRGYGTQADWTRCRFCRAPFEIDAGQGEH